MRRYKPTGAIKGALGLAGVGLATGLGAQIVSKAGGDAGGLNALAGFSPVMGTVMGAGVSINMIQGIIPRNRRRR